MMNNRGQALMQVIVAAAILAIVMGGFATMMSQMGSMQAQMQSRQDVTSVVADVQTLFSSSTACKAALDPNAPFIFTTAQKAYPNGQSLVLNLNASDSLKKATELNNYRLVTNDIQIVNAHDIGADISGNEIYSGQVVAQFSPKKAGGGGLSDYNVRTMVSGYFSVAGGNKIVGCSSEAPSADATKVAENCTALGGTFDTTARKCNFVSSKLVLTCPTGQAVIGFENDGSPRCAAATTTASTTGSSGTGSSAVPATIAGARCPAGQGVAGFATDGTPQCSGSIGGTGATGATGAPATCASNPPPGVLVSGKPPYAAGTRASNCSCFVQACTGHAYVCAGGVWVGQVCIPPGG